MKNNFNQDLNSLPNRNDNKDFVIISTYSSSSPIKDNDIICRHLIVS